MYPNHPRSESKLQFLLSPLITAYNMLPLLSERMLVILLHELPFNCRLSSAFSGHRVRTHQVIIIIMVIIIMIIITMGFSSVYYMRWHFFSTVSKLS